MQGKPLDPTSTEAILESICDGVFTVDATWHITSFNRAAEEITGVAREDAIGQICSEVFRCSLCENNCALAETLQSDKPIVQREGFIIRADGQRVPISISTAVLRDAAGNVIGGAETFRDLSEIETLRNSLQQRYRVGDLISHSSTMEPIFDLISTLADSSSTVLIEGETGTGKQLVARAIHSSGARADEPFVAVNCGALPDNLLESELFGYKRGAFTGAQQDKPGRLHSAGRGTLFLDEIGEISAPQQIKLLRVLQELQFEPLGGTKPEPLEARIIAATNRSLTDMVTEGTFRQDLFYRIQVITLELPPLRARMEDIPLLVEHFIQHFNQTQNRAIQGCQSDTMTLLMAHDWPGNVRELENVIEHAFILCRTEMIEPAHLPPTLRGSRPLTSASNPKTEIRTQRDLSEKHAILAALEEHDYNRQAAARTLGIHKTTLYRKIKALAIPLPTKNRQHHP